MLTIFMYIMFFLLLNIMGKDVSQEESSSVIETAIQQQGWSC